MLPVYDDKSDDAENIIYDAAASFPPMWDTFS